MLETNVNRLIKLTSEMMTFPRVESENTDRVERREGKTSVFVIPKSLPLTEIKDVVQKASGESLL